MYIPTHNSQTMNKMNKLKKISFLYLCKRMAIER